VSWPWRIAGYAGIAAVIVLLPHTLIGDSVASQFAYVGIFFIAILGLDILTGHAGQISLGHSAFMALGAYTTGILAVNHGVNIYLTILLGGVVAGVAGFLFGFPALRLTGLYLALATFALAVVVPSLARRFDEFTGGTAGILLPLPTSPTTRLSPYDWLYYLTWVIAGAMFLASVLLLRGKMGRALRAIREDELAATSSGVSLTVYKTLAFGLSAFYAGVAGSLYSIQAFIVNPGTFPIELSIVLLVGFVVGGSGTLLGLIAGAAFIEFVWFVYPVDILGKVIDFGQRLKLPIDDLDPTTSGVAFVVTGVILLVVLFLMPRGLSGLIRLLGGLTKQVYDRQRARVGLFSASRREV
jgi:branched-chain amino acid transport system permease protein